MSSCVLCERIKLVDTTLLADFDNKNTLCDECNRIELFASTDKDKGNFKPIEQDIKHLNGRSYKPTITIAYGEHKLPTKIPHKPIDLMIISNVYQLNPDDPNSKLRNRS